MDAQWVSDELSELLARLTAQQARGVLRIVQAEIDGRTITSLLEGEDRICAATTYYGGGKRKGWRDKPTFRRALDLARQEYRSWMLQHGTEEALAILSATAPESARALRQRVTGDDRAIATLVAALESDSTAERGYAAKLLGETGLPRTVPALQVALTTEEDKGVRELILGALGDIAAGSARDIDTPLEVLDRGDLKTATKGTRALTGGDGGPIGVADRSGIAGVVAELDDEELDQFLVNLEAVERASEGS